MSAQRHELAIVLPMRGIASGKSRLAAVLDAPARAAFNAWLLRHTLDAVDAWRGVDACVVVSACDAVGEIACARGAAFVQEARGIGLNAAAALGFEYAQARGCAAALVLPCDLPQLSRAALEDLARSMRPGHVLIAPDEGGCGTNAIAAPARAAFRFCFGADSFERHRRAAAQAGLGVTIFRSPPLAFDVDTPADYARCRALRADTPVI